MALESGTYVQDLVVTNPEGSDSKSSGDDHLRLIKSVLSNTFPNADRAIRLQDRRIVSVSSDTSLELADEGGVVVVTGSDDEITVTLPTSAPAGWIVGVRYAKTAGEVLIAAGTGESIDGAGLLTSAVDDDSNVVLKYTYDSVFLVKGSGTAWAVEQSSVIGPFARPWQPSGSRLLSQIILSTDDPVEASIPDGTLYLKYESDS